jgi:hypothetical protein
MLKVQRWEVNSSSMKRTDDEVEGAAGGSLSKGFLLALLCHVAYFLLVLQLSLAEARVIGKMMFALVQFAYLFPLAVFYHKRDQDLTSNGIIIAGALSLFASAAWFGYAALHGMLPSISGS